VALKAEKGGGSKSGGPFIQAPKNRIREKGIIQSIRGKNRGNSSSRGFQGKVEQRRMDNLRQIRSGQKVKRSAKKFPNQGIFRQGSPSRQKFQKGGG